MTTVTRELLERFDVPGPRYTSYPTADRFVEAFGARDYELALEQRRSGPAALALPLSIYVHIPFCESLCYYCACNKIITKHHERSAPYLQLLSREVDLHVRHLGRGASVSQLHLGGGTPTFFNDEELAELMAMLRRNFSLVPGGEYSIEVDPRTVDETRLETLARLGFNRLSFGVQDFDPTVQKAVHRVQPAEQVFALVAAARRIGFESVNVDLIYGLPKQTPESFDRTLAQVTELRPDRIALYAYAHLPERFKPQRRIIAIDLTPEKLETAREFGATQGVLAGPEAAAAVRAVWTSGGVPASSISGRPSRESSTATGRAAGICEQTIIVATMIGTARNIPGMPQTAPQKLSETMMPKDETRSALPISIGSRTEPSTNWIIPAMTKTTSAVAGSFTWISATRPSRIVAMIDPTDGM